ncbi:MAG: choice-of-anchor L domain-containing protein, partial [Flavobacteriales bacterium]
MKRFCVPVLVRLVIAMGLIGTLLPARAQLVVNQTQAPTTLVQNLLMGPGVFATNVTFNGNPGNTLPAASTPGQIGRFNGVNTCLGLNAGVFITSSCHPENTLAGPNDQLMPYSNCIGGSGFFTTPEIDLSRLTGWPLWQATGGNNIGDKAMLEFDFVPTHDMISVRYVFSSEEYERWACSQYNDVFGFFISGPGITGPFTNNAMNIAFIPGSMTPVAINTVNSGVMDVSNANGPWTDPFRPCFDADPNWQANSIYYRYNGGQWTYPGAGAGPQLEAPYNTDPYYIQHNGMTVVLTASAAVECGQMYHIKMGVGNVADNDYPSAVWLEQGSFTSSDRFKLTVDPGPTVEYTATDTIFIENNCDSVYLRFHR